jgi:cytosine/creatinine deaminase
MGLPAEHMSPAAPLGGARVAEMLAVALAEARHGLAEGGIPIGAALFHLDGTLLGRGRNRRRRAGAASATGVSTVTSSMPRSRNAS